MLDDVPDSWTTYLMIKAVEFAAIIGVLPAIAIIDMREEVIRTACPVAFAYLEAERIAGEYAGPGVSVSFAPERWIGQCHLELEGEIRNAVPHSKPRRITVTLRVTDEGRLLISSR
ncbi:hypothetical protein MRBLMR1_004988 [Neorhizobium sp. LMR1-1-1.1]